VTDTSVDSDSPPRQDTRAVIRSWHTEGYQLRLEDDGNDGAVIVCEADGAAAQTFGEISYDPVKARHVINWNRDGCLAIESYKRDHWDSKFYYVMAAWRSRT
jgi:hypothetical protein